MLGFYSARTIGVLFGEKRLESFHKTFSAGCSIVFLCLVLLALGILKFDLHNSNPIHHLLRHTVAISLVLLALFSIICTLFYVRESKDTIYSVSPLLLTPIAFAMYSLDLIDYSTGISSAYSFVYAISRLVNCIAFAYSLLVIRRNTRGVAILMVIEFILAIALLVIQNTSVIYEISLIIWASIFQFSISLLVGTKLVKKRDNQSISDLITFREGHKDTHETVRIRAWLPNTESGSAHISLPLFGRYAFAYSLKARNILVGHISLESDSFYASIYPDHQVWLADKKISSGRAIGSSHRKFYPGIWQSFVYDIKTRGNAYSDCTVDVVDPHHLISVWHAIKKDSSYSLYSRNCAIVTVRLFEECIRHSLSQIPLTSGILRTYLSPYFWRAIIAKQRSEIFTWSPGLAYDYILSLNILIKNLKA